MGPRFRRAPAEPVGYSLSEPRRERVEWKKGPKEQASIMQSYSLKLSMFISFKALPAILIM